MTGPIVEVGRYVSASPERLFDAWLDPEQAGRWLFATPDGRMEKVEIDPRFGGRFLIVERRGEEMADHRGEYVEIDRPRKLVFKFAALGENVFTRVTVRIAEEGEGSRISLVHEMDPRWADHEARTREGWTKILDGLAQTLGEAEI